MKSIFTLASFLIFLSVYGQVIAPPSSSPETTTIAQVAAEGKLVAEFYYLAPGEKSIGSPRAIKYDTIFAIRFLNFKSLPVARYVTLEFNKSRIETDSLYRLLKTVFLDKNKDDSNYSISLTFNDGDMLQAKPYKKDNSYLCELSFNDAYCRLSESNIDDLFKKKNISK